MSFSILDIQSAISEGNVLWKKHALERMMERGISRSRVKQAVLECNIIENYPNDYPVPSFLIATLIPDPLHVVASYDVSNGILYVITVYEPDLIHFESDYVTRL